jgi:hypothetical protein
MKIQLGWAVVGVTDPVKKMITGGWGGKSTKIYSSEGIAKAAIKLSFNASELWKVVPVFYEEEND